LLYDEIKAVAKGQLVRASVLLNSLG
jgi:hypothetical protein